MNENKPTWIQRIKLHLFGYTYIEHRQQPGWKGPLPFYMFRCPEHGLVVDHPHGYWELWKDTIPVKVDNVLSQLTCPLCTEKQHTS